mgnify:CR=1 FL=1
MNIAIIEDDSKIRLELSKLLENNGYKTKIINDFQNILEEIKNVDIDLIILDINLPYESGYEICKKIKKHKNIPIIFVTSRNTSEDELLSILAGGIDFITKPYNKNILLEKIKRALNNTNFKNYRQITRKNYTLDLHLSILKYNNQEVELTRNEFRILYYFFTEPDRIITKDELLDNLWNDKYYLDENILMVNINRLRNKAKDIGINNLLQTIRGKGYKL